MADVSQRTIEAHYWPQSIVEIDYEARANNWTPDEIEKLWNVHDLMARLFSGRYRGSGRPFINHLAGTAALVLRHGGSAAEVLAGYAHAAYEQGEFGRSRKGAFAANRAEVSAVVGEAAEAMIVDYGNFDWSGITGRRVTSEALSLSGQEKKILFLQIANELDDSFDCGVYDPAWCEGCLSRMMAGADFAEALAKYALADLLRARVEYVRASGLDSAEGRRPKRSETIPNPSFKSSYLLQKKRSFARRWDKWRGAR